MVQVSNSEDEPDRFSGVHSPGLIIAQIDNNSEEEGEEMALNRKKGLHELLANRAKGLVPKDTSRSQPFPCLPPPPTVNPFVVANLKKKRKEKEVAKEGEVVTQKEPKH